MKCFRLGCKNEKMKGCVHNQCEYHHQRLCLEQHYKDTEHGLCSGLEEGKE